MATDHGTDHQVGDNKPDSQITNAGQQGETSNDINADAIGSKLAEVDIKIDLESSDASRAPDTQGSNLPKLTQVIITNVRQLKHNSKNPEGWTLRVRCALAQLRLEHLIDSSIPRPLKGQHNYNRWVQWSRTVARWLYLQVDKTMQERLQSFHRILSKADALFDRILKLVQEGENTNLIPGANNDRQKRSEFETVRKYIAAHQTQYHLLGSKLLPVFSLR